MTLSMYQASVPVFIRALTNLSNVLDKGIAHVEAKKIDGAAIVNFRLFPDMLPFAAQIRIAGDIAKGGGARLAGIDPPKFEDNETTLAELSERIKKTIAFLQTIKAEQVDGSEARDITMPTRGEPMKFKGQGYLLGFVLPNIYFHCATAYNILRHNGVEIGKTDFIGKQA